MLSLWNTLNNDLYCVFFKSFCMFVIKFFSHIGLQIFHTSSIISNYFCYCYVQTLENLVKETMRKNGEGMKGRLDSISQMYAQRSIAVSRTHLFNPRIWVNVPKERYDTCSDRVRTSILLFRSRNLILLTCNWISCDLRY